MADAPPPAGVKRERDGAAKGKGGKGVVAPAAPAKRVKDAAVCCPLVYGSLAFWLGRKADEFHTHKWTLFVRGPHGEDLGYFVEKVVFKLHPSFAQPVREVTKPPFEVSEKGGAVRMYIQFNDETPRRSPWRCRTSQTFGGTTPHAANQPVVSEVYDSGVLDPLGPFYQQLMAPKGPTEPHPLNGHFSKFEDAAEVGRSSGRGVRRGPAQTGGIR